MQIAQTIGSLTLAEADLVRRAKAKFADQRERERLRAKFLKAAARLRLEGEELERTWQMVEKFAGFGFCKAHAATYADLSYRMAYLKAHYPAEFLAGMCSAGAGFYHVSAYVEEAKRWGVPVRLPSVNRSRAEYSVEAASDGEKRAMRIGLMQVKGLRAETIAAIVGSREREGEYRSLEDFLKRVPANRDELHALIKCGAFDDVAGEEFCSGTEEKLPAAAGQAPRGAISSGAGGMASMTKGGEAEDARLKPGATLDRGPGAVTRPMRLWQLNLLLAGRAVATHAGALLFPEPRRTSGGTAAIPPLADYDREQRLAYEQELLEVAVSGHPLDRIRRNGEAWSNELGKRVGQRVELLGWLITFRAVGTKDYRNMMFLTLEDQRGVYEAILFPDVYERYGGLVFETRTLRVWGRVEGEAQVHCDKLEPVKP